MLVGAFNQEKALVGAFSVIVQPVVEPMDHFTALVLGRLVPNAFISTFQICCKLQHQLLLLLFGLITGHLDNVLCTVTSHHITNLHLFYGVFDHIGISS